MAGNIKGITIEFDGNTTKLDSALKQIDKETANIDAELKKVNNALKFNPTSVELWRQKQTLLTQKITDTQKKLDALKQAQKQMDAKGVDKNSAEYRNLQREIITTQSKLKTFKAQLREVGNVKLRAASEQLKQIGSKATAAGNAMRGISKAAAAVALGIGALTKKSAKWADDVVTASKVYGTSTKELQKYYAAANLVDVSAESIVSTHRKLERNMLNASLGSKKQALAFKELGIEYQNADGSLREGDKVWQDTILALSKMTNETERDAYAMALMGRSATDLNPLIEDGAEGYKLLSDAMSKYDLEFVDDETLQKANDFNDQMDIMKSVTLIALQNLGAELAGVLEPALKRVVDVAGNFANWISGLNPTIVAVIGGIAALVAAIAPALLLFGALATAAGAVAGVLAGISPIVIAIAASIAALVAAFTAAYASSEEFRTAINEIVAGLGQRLKPLIDLVVAGFKELFAVIVQTAQEIVADLAPVIQQLEPVILFLADVITATLMVAFMALVNYIKRVAATVRMLAKVFSTVFLAIVKIVKDAYAKLKGIINSIKAAFNGLAGIAGKVRSAFNSIKNAITHPIQSAVSIVRGAISKIKGILNTRLSLPHIKLPHFSIKGKFSLDPPSIPKIGVKWYAQGGIFNKATLAGIGEAGPEAVIPLDTLWKKLDAIAAAGSEKSVTVNVYTQPGMNIDQLTAKIEQVLIREQRQRQKAWGY